MNAQWYLRVGAMGLWLGWSSWLPSLYAQQAPAFTGIERLTNREIALTFTGESGMHYRLEAATILGDWSGLWTAMKGGAAPLQFTDSAAPFLGARYYRAVQVGTTGVFTGDHVTTTNGDVIIQPLLHATLVMSWQGKALFVDPDDTATYSGLPKADLVLLTHAHSDHLSTTTIEAVRRTNAVLIAPQDVYGRLTTAQRALTRVLAYGESTNVLGLEVEAVPAYNANHAYGLGNGYVLTIGGKRLYLSGDTGNTPEMRALSDVDVAFICINQPYTLSPSDAANAVSAFKPRVVYPYHYRDQSGAMTNAAYFKQLIPVELGIEVRLREWY